MHLRLHHVPGTCYRLLKRNKDLAHTVVFQVSSSQQSTAVNSSEPISPTYTLH